MIILDNLDIGSTMRLLLPNMRMECSHLKAYRRQENYDPYRPCHPNTPETLFKWHTEPQKDWLVNRHRTDDQYCREYRYMTAQPADTFAHVLHELGDDITSNPAGGIIALVNNPIFSTVKVVISNIVKKQMTKTDPKTRWKWQTMMEEYSGEELMVLESVKHLFVSAAGRRDQLSPELNVNEDEEESSLLPLEVVPVRDLLVAAKYSDDLSLQHAVEEVIFSNFHV